MSRTTLLPAPPEAPASGATGAEVLFKEARQRRRRRRILLATVAAMAVAATAVALSVSAGGSVHAAKPVPAPAVSPPPVHVLGTPPDVAWVDYAGQVHVGSLLTHQQRVVASGSAGATTSMVASGSTLFWVDGGGLVYDKTTRRVRSLPRGVMAYDTGTGHVRAFASGVQVFNAQGSTDVFVGSDDGRHLARFSLDGRLLDRFTFPAGWYLPDPFGLGTSSPALAYGQILVQSQTAFQAHTVGAKTTKLAVWMPATGSIRQLGDMWATVATYTDVRGQSSLVAWLPYRCEVSNESCSVQLTDLATGATRQIRNPLGFGFDMRGAFSPDGRQLAAFAKTNSGGYNPETRLALIGVDSGTVRAVPGATIEIGESVAWAQWLPDSRQLIAGGTSGQDGSGTWGANHFLVDSVTLHAKPFAFLHDGQQDVNYSAVLLP